MSKTPIQPFDVGYWTFGILLEIRYWELGTFTQTLKHQPKFRTKHRQTVKQPNCLTAPLFYSPTTCGAAGKLIPETILIPSIFSRIRAMA